MNIQFDEIVRGKRMDIQTFRAPGGRTLGAVFCNHERDDGFSPWGVEVCRNNGGQWITAAPLAMGLESRDIAIGFARGWFAAKDDKR